MSSSDFQLPDLYSALDAERQKRQLTWTALVREISGPFADRGSRPLALSTVTSLRTKSVAER